MLSPEQIMIILIASFVAGSCALVGTFLVLRKVAMVGDAISHAVLPGVAIAFLLTGQRSMLPMLIGAGAFGVLTVFCVGLLNRTRRMYEDASIGVVFPALFSLGVLLIARYASHVDLDLDCVLYGEIAYAPLDLWTVGTLSLGPRALWLSAFVFVGNLVWVTLCYKELKVTSFDAGIADAMGISSTKMHYFLMSAVSLTVVASFEAVGAVLVVAMLIVPPATAYLLTYRLSWMCVLSVAFGVLSAISGYGVAHWLDASISGAMAVSAGVLFVVAFVISPRYGMVWLSIKRRRMQSHFRRHLVLLHVGKDETTRCVHDDLERRFGWRRGVLECVIRDLVRDQLIDRSDYGLCLTEKGLHAIEAAGTSPLIHR